MVRSVRASESLSLIIISEVVLPQDEALLLRHRMEKISGADIDIAIVLHRRQHMCCSAKFFPHRCARKPCELLFLGVVHFGRYSRSMVDGGDRWEISSQVIFEEEKKCEVRRYLGN